MSVILIFIIILLKSSALLLLKIILKTPIYYIVRTARIYVKSHSTASKYMLYSKGTVYSISRVCYIYKHHLSILLSNWR